MQLKIKIPCMYGQRHSDEDPRPCQFWRSNLRISLVYPDSFNKEIGVTLNASCDKYPEGIPFESLEKDSEGIFECYSPLF